MKEDCKACGTPKVRGKDYMGCVTYICPKCGSCPTLILAKR